MAEISNEPNSLNLVIVQGSDLTFGVAITDPATDFTSATAKAKVVADYATRSLIIALTIVVNTATNGSMTLTVSLTAAQTGAITNTAPGSARQSIGVWDLDVVLASGRVIRMIMGSVILSREATT